MARVKLPFDMMKTDVELELPEEATVDIVTPRDLGTLPLDEVKRKISQGLGRHAGEIKGKEAVVLVDDYTRPTPTRELLPFIVEELEKLGAAEVRILYAKGVHEVLSPELVEIKVGPLLGKYDVILHNAYVEYEQEFVGFTRLGLPLWVNEVVAEADVKIGITSVAPAPWEGFAGGGDLILPGSAFYESIALNNQLALSPRARVGLLAGNPVRENIDEACRMVQVNIVVNLVLRPSSTFERPLVSGAFVDTPEESFEKAVGHARELYEFGLKEPYDLIVASPGGREDYSFATGAKALLNLEPALRDGGWFVLVASCPAGLGWPELEAALELAKYERVEAEDIARSVIHGEIEPLAGALMIHLRRLLLEGRCRLAIVSRQLSPEVAELLGAEIFDTAEEALRRALRELGPRPRILVAPYAAFTYLRQGGAS